MKVVVGFAAVLAAVVFSSLAVAGRSHAERYLPNAADRAAAIRIGLQARDQPGWRYRRQTGTHPTESGACPGWDPDLSRFTVTGGANASLTSNAKRALTSVLVFRSDAEAAADFRLQTTPSGLLCQRTNLANGVRKSMPPGYEVLKIERATKRNGARGVTHAVDALVAAPDKRTFHYMALAFVFYEGRSIVMVGFSYPGPAVMPELQRLSSLVILRSVTG